MEDKYELFILREKIENMQELTSEINWKKEHTWNKLEEKIINSENGFWQKLKYVGLLLITILVFVVAIIVKRQEVKSFRTPYKSVNSENRYNKGKVFIVQNKTNKEFIGETDQNSATELN